MMKSILKLVVCGIVAISLFATVFVMVASMMPAPLFKDRELFRTFTRAPISDSFNSRCHFDFAQNMVAVLVSRSPQHHWVVKSPDRRVAVFTMSEGEITVESKPNTLVVVIGRERQEFPIEPSAASKWRNDLVQRFAEEASAQRSILDEIVKVYRGEQRDKLVEFVTLAKRSLGKVDEE